jgi:trigger factor
MKTELSEVSPARRRLVVEIPASDVDQTYDRVLKGFRRSLKLPGFRPGKAPLDVVRSRVGSELHATVAERLIESFAARAVEQERLRPIEGSIRMQLQDDSDTPPPAAPGAPYKFVLTADVMPEFELGEYKQIKVARSTSEVQPEEIERELDALRESRARTVPVEGRASAEGDLIEVDIEGKELGGEPIAPRSTRTLQIGDERNMPEFNRRLTGLRAGEDFAFEVQYPDDYSQESLRGKNIYFRGEVRSVLERILPDLDDDLARSFEDGIESLADLRRRVSDSIAQGHEREAERLVRRRLLDKLLESNTFEAPPTLVETEMRHRLDDLGRSLAAQGLDPEKLDIDWKQIVEKQRVEAERTVREAIILDAVAGSEGLRVEQADLDGALEEIAAGTGETKAAARKRLEKAGSIESLSSQILRRKSLDWLVANANIV